MVSVFVSFEFVVCGVQQQVQVDVCYFVEVWKSEKVIYMMGSGFLFGVVYQEFICILLEMQWINFVSIYSGEYFYGFFEIIEMGMLFILLKSSGCICLLDDCVICFIECYQGKLQIIDVEKVGIDVLYVSVCEYFCGLLYNCVLDVYNLVLVIVCNYLLIICCYMWKVEY